MQKLARKQLQSSSAKFNEESVTDSYIVPIVVSGSFLGNKEFSGLIGYRIYKNHCSVNFISSNARDALGKTFHDAILSLFIFSLYIHASVLGKDENDFILLHY